jgi:hypothetical protein
MSIVVRSQAKVAAALLAASVVAAPALVATEHETVPVLSNIEVRPASLVTDALYNLGDAINAGANALVIGTDVALGLNFYSDDYDFGWGVPFNPVFAAITAVQNPGDIGGLASYIAQLYLNGSNNYTYYGYPWYLNRYVLEPLASALLPSTLSTPINNTIENVANAINNLFANLPDPSAAANSMNALYSTVAGRLVYAVQAAVAIPAYLVADLAYWAAYVPANLEATVESAIQTPADIPGLLSNLVDAVLNPTLGNGLLGNVLYDISKPSFFLPSPIGETSLNSNDGLAYNLYQNIVTAVTNLLNNLPTPILPTPFPSAATATATPSAGAVASETASQPAAKTVATAGSARQASAGKSSANSVTGVAKSTSDSTGSGKASAAESAAGTSAAKNDGSGSAHGKGQSKRAAKSNGAD